MDVLDITGFSSALNPHSKIIEERYYEELVYDSYTVRKLDLADASIIILANHLNIGNTITVDRKDFSILRWAGGIFNNLLS